ncbi:MAG: gliding motility-associated C-terminal domain-containing protein [Chitinophagaceae bacterium]
MPRNLLSRIILLLFFILPVTAGAQQCTELGQTPTTAFPVCGTTTFHQETVPICSSASLFVPGCESSGSNYENKNPYWYKFTCFTAGTLGFEITPTDVSDDYDWQLYDISGLDPDEVFTNRNIIISGNWAGTTGKTGAGTRGTNNMECASDPRDNVNPFSKLINLVQGHNYILLVSHFTDSQSGYSLDFSGGTAVITDPADPHIFSVKPDCDGIQLRVKLNKKMKCSSLTATGSEFTLSPSAANIIAAQPLNCNGSFDFDSVLLTLSAPLNAGIYSLLTDNGSDGTTILDNCSRSIPQGETINFEYINPRPIYADSLAAVGCAPTRLYLYFPKRINCATISADGSDFRITGPAPVTVVSAGGICTNGFSDIIVITLAAPISDRGTYFLELKAGSDGSAVIDECGLETPLDTLSFVCADTVSAAFNYTMVAGCRENTLNFIHNGAHQVNNWNWILNNGTPINTQTHQAIVPATSINNISLVVSNGTCSDSLSTVITIDNEVIAAFEMPSIICPEDGLQVVNKSTGLIDVWNWEFERMFYSTLKDPNPVLFPTTNRDAAYTVKLKATNTTLGCTDSIRKTIRVLANCFIAVPTGFTPNKDGINDYLYPNNAIKAENLEFRVFNRWGQLVFHSREWTAKWDGTINGIPQGSGVYVWFLQYTHRDTRQLVTQKGTTTLIR